MLEIFFKNVNPVKIKSGENSIENSGQTFDLARRETIRKRLLEIL